MYLYTTVQVISHVFVYYGSSKRSCILCVIWYRLCIFLRFFYWILNYFDSVVYLFLFLFYQVLCSSYMYGNMIYLSHKMFLSVLHSWLVKRVNHFWDLGKRKGASFPRVPMIVVGRSEHPFMNICDLHEQLLLSIEKMKIVTFASCFLMAYKSRFTFIGSH